LAWQCERWKTLPDDGNLYGQNYCTILRMTALSNIYNTVQRTKSLKGEMIHRLSEGERKILRMLMDMGILFNA